MCRFGSQHLTGILPIVLSELVSLTRSGDKETSGDNHVIMISQIRSFEEMLEELPADNAIDLKTSLATCKLLDLMLALSMEEFHM
jgi:hypothetical protein